MEEFKRSLAYLLAAGKDAQSNPRGKPSVQRIAGEMGVNRATVARNLAIYRRMGYLDGSYRLTPAGKAWMDSYTQHRERLVSWMVRNGVSREHAEADAFEILNHCSSEAIALLCRSGHPDEECGRFPGKADTGWFGVSGEKAIRQLKEYFPDGSYQVHFAIYKEYSERSLLEYSMANKGFETPAVLEIKGQDGVLRLKRRAMRRQSLDGRWYSGMLASLKYEQDSYFHEAEIIDDVAAVPMGAFRIVYESGCRTVRGMARVLMSCTAGKAAMPESAGLLEFKLWMGRGEPKASPPD